MLTIANNTCKNRKYNHVTVPFKMDETGQAPTFDEAPTEDPAAAFLQREQDELGDLGEDSLGFTPGSVNVSIK